MPKVPYTCFNRVGKDYLSGKAICTETTWTVVMYAEKDCNGKTIVPPNGGPSYYPRGACTKVKDQSFGPGDWFVLATCPNYPPSALPAAAKRFIVKHKMKLSGMSKETFNSNPKIISAFKNTAAAMLKVPTNTIKHVRACAVGSTDADCATTNNRLRKKYYVFCC